MPFDNHCPAFTGQDCHPRQVEKEKGKRKKQFKSNLYYG